MGFATTGWANGAGDLHWQAALKAKAFFASYKLTPTGTGHVRILISNPAASGKTCVFYKLDNYSDAPAALDLTVFANPTAGLPTTLETLRPHIVLASGTAATPVSTLKRDFNTLTAMSGGTTLGIEVSPPGRYNFEHIYIIEQGASFGYDINVTSPGAFNVWVKAYIYEI
jgi:hypothetical protein